VASSPVGVVRAAGTPWCATRRFPGESPCRTHLGTDHDPTFVPARLLSDTTSAQHFVQADAASRHGLTQALDRMENSEALYLRDLGFLLKERALEALVQAREERLAGRGEFHIGRSAAFYEVISIMLSQAEGFDIPAEALSLGGVNAERDFIA
jgi:hypothetical protein